MLTRTAGVEPAPHRFSPSKEQRDRGMHDHAQKQDQDKRSQRADAGRNQKPDAGGPDRYDDEDVFQPLGVRADHYAENRRMEGALKKDNFIALAVASNLFGTLRPWSHALARR